MSTDSTEKLGLSARDKKIGVLGGTGPQGKGIALRLARAGVQISIGSRDAERAAKTASELGNNITGTSNVDCAEAAEIVIVAVPYDGHKELLESLGEQLAGKIVIDCVNALGFDKQGPYPLSVPEGSVCQQAASVLPDSTIVGAFHNVSAEVLLDDSVEDVGSDVLVLAEDRAAADSIIDLVNVIPGLRGIFAGRLRNAGQVEALTANLIAINRRYKTHSSIRITGI